MTKDIIKLLVLVAVVTSIILGIYFLGKSTDNRSKYKHPIVQPGARW